MDFLFFGHGKVMENTFWKRVVTLTAVWSSFAKIDGEICGDFQRWGYSLPTERWLRETLGHIFWCEGTVLSGYKPHSC